MSELALFAIPIKIYDLDVLAYISDAHNIEMEKIENGWLSVNRKVLTTDNKFFKLKDDLNNIIDDYIYNFCGIKNREDGEFIVSTSWVVKHNPDDWSHEHYHHNSLFSGCVYFDVPENSGDLVFHKDPSHQNFLSSTLTFDIDNWNIFNSMSWTLEPKEGMVVLFPSQIKHSVNANMSKQPRYCLSFNVWYKGKTGNKESEMVI